MDKYAIIVAGGSGQRMENELPKQFIELDGKPILMHTLEAFNIDEEIHITLVLPGDQFGYWQDLILKYDFQVPHQLVSGGETRFHSVKNGLDAIESYDGCVAVHDGVRPFVTKTIIDNSFNTAQSLGNAVTSVTLKDSLRHVSLDGNTSVIRSEYVLIQTPQAFRLDSLKDCYTQEHKTEFTDDASVVESKGIKINLIEGDESNIKITTPQDLILAEAIIQSKK